MHVHESEMWQPFGLLSMTFQDLYTPCILRTHHFNGHFAGKPGLAGYAFSFSISLQSEHLLRTGQTFHILLDAFQSSRPQASLLPSSINLHLHKSLDPIRDGSTLGQEAHAPRFTCCPQIQKLAGKIISWFKMLQIQQLSRPIRNSYFYRFRRTDKMGSVMMGLMGQWSQNFWTRTTPGSNQHGFYIQQVQITISASTIRIYFYMWCSTNAAYYLLTFLIVEPTSSSPNICTNSHIK